MPSLTGLLNKPYDDLEMEKIKQNQFEMYGTMEMLEILGITVAQDEECTDIVYKLCQLTSTNKK